MKRYTWTQYLNAGCSEVKDKIGLGLYIITGGKICDNGCNRYKKGQCPAFIKLTSPESTPGPVMLQYTETVREEAQRRAISIKNVRKERRDLANKQQRKK